MTTPLEQKSVIEPEWPDVFLNFKQDVFSTLNCHMPGIIESFDPDACTAVVQPVFKRKIPSGDIVSRQQLIHCPVYFPGGGGARFTFPIEKGDQCLILYADRRIDEWVSSGLESLPGDPRMHDLSDGLIIVGFDPQGDLGPVPTDKVVISYKNSSFELTESGYNFIAEGGSEIDVSDTIDLTANAGAEITLDAKVSIKNATTSLLLVINNFITLLEGLQVLDPVGPTNLPLTPAFIALLEAYKTQVAELLE